MYLILGGGGGGEKLFNRNIVASTLQHSKRRVFVLLYRIILSSKMSTSTIKHLKLFMLQFIMIYL